MKFDDILVHIGEFGKYQKIQYFLACITAVFCGAQVLSTVYVVYVPSHRCRLPASAWPNDNWDTRNNSTHEALLKKFIPTDEDGNFEKCKIFNVTPTPGNYSEISCDSWVYDRSEMKESFISQYDVVCDQGYWKLVITQCYLVGVLVGSPIFGVVSDSIGRKKALMIGVVMSLIFGVASSFVTLPILMAIGKFMIGCSVSCLFPCAFVLGMELVGPNRRLDAGIIIEYAFALGVVLDALIGCLIRQWTWIQFTISLPIGFCIALWWLMPESPRWLIGHDRDEEAKEILLKAAKVNNKTLPENFLQKEQEGPKGTILDVLKSKILLLRSLIIFFQWAVTAMVYYGISLSTSNLPGSMYLNAFLSGAVEFPGYAIVHVLLNRLGRKKLFFIVTFVSGIFCSSAILLVYFAENVLWAFIVVSMLGKCFNTSAFAIIYIWTSELYPTVVRSVGVGSASMFARIGTLLAPVIGDLNLIVEGKIGKALPLLIFGIVSVVAAVLSLLLPETFGCPLPETIEEGERFGRESARVQPMDSVIPESGVDNPARQPNHKNHRESEGPNGREKTMRDSGHTNPALVTETV